MMLRCVSGPPIWIKRRQPRAPTACRTQVLSRCSDLLATELATLAKGALGRRRGLRCGQVTCTFAHGMGQSESFVPGQPPARVAPIADRTRRNSTPPAPNGGVKPMNEEAEERYRPRLRFAARLGAGMQWRPPRRLRRVSRSSLCRQSPGATCWHAIRWEASWGKA
jgi:hypothetical protein